MGVLISAVCGSTPAHLVTFNGGAALFLCPVPCRVLLGNNISSVPTSLRLLRMLQRL